MKLKLTATAKQGSQEVEIVIETSGRCPAFDLRKEVETAQPFQFTCLLKPSQGLIGSDIAKYTYTRKPTTEKEWVLKDQLAALAQHLTHRHAEIVANLPAFDFTYEVEK